MYRQREGVLPRELGARDLPLLPWRCRDCRTLRVLLLACEEERSEAIVEEGRGRRSVASVGCLLALL